MMINNVVIIIGFKNSRLFVCFFVLFQSQEEYAEKYSL